jgi:hypothetical protein
MVKSPNSGKNPQKSRGLTICLGATAGSSSSAFPAITLLNTPVPNDKKFSGFRLQSPCRPVSIAGRRLDRTAVGPFFTQEFFRLLQR